MAIKSGINFSKEQIEKLFPFYVEINSDLKITALGPSLKKLIGVKTDKLFFDEFAIQRPFFKSVSWDSLNKSSHELFIINHKKNEILFRGQFEYLESRNTLFFIGTPWVQNIDALKEKKLFIADFAIHDPTFDLLHIIKNIEINSDEIKVLLNKLKEKSEIIKQSEAQSKAILNMASEVIYRTNEKGFFIYVNPAGERLSGYSCKELYSKKFTDLIRSDYKSKTIAKYLNQIRDDLESTYYEFPIIDKSGREKWLAQSVQFIKNETGFEFVALAIDITKQKQNEFELTETNKSLELLGTLINNTSDAIQVSLEDGQLVYLNNEAAKRLGIDMNSMKSHFVQDFEIIFQKSGEWEKHVDEIKEKGTLIIEGKNVNKETGVTFPVEVTVKHVTINSVGYIIANSRDISERKKIEENVRKQKEKYENIIANMNLGLMEVDLEEKIKFVNPGFEQISGYSSDELINKKASSLFIAETHVELMSNKMKVRMSGQSDMYEVLIKNKSGEYRWWMISGAPNYNEKGELIGSIGIHLDITLAKQLELELEMAKIKAEESSKAKEAFLANMSHEIRTPLNAIIGMIRELKKEKLSEKQAYYVNSTSIASQHLFSVLNNVLDISKIEAGELQLEMQDFDLQTILNDVKSIMMAKCLEKNLYFQIIGPKNIETVFIGDASRFRQVLINLIGNAVKFTEEGGVTIDYSVTKINSENTALELLVTDTGIGIDGTFLKNIFNKFSQEDASVSRKYGGSGLGMAITRELIQLMNGHIEIQSAKNVGTKISMKFILPTGKIENIKEQKLDFTKAKTTAILLVEDNEFNRIVAKNTLSNYNCQITEAQNGKEAIYILKKNQNFDIILMDLQMPVMDGFESTKIIRNKLKLKIPIVALTANAFKSELEQCRKIGMDDSITKPFEEKKLMEVIFKLTQNNSKNSENDSHGSLLYNLERLEVLFKGDKVQISKMITIFVEQITKAIDEIMDAYSTKNFETVYQTVHRIKPSIDSMGITSLKEVTRFIEKNAKERNDTAELQNKLNVLIATLQKVLKQLK
ncbi:MAG: PAS domain S-box protein [Bacteroidota bacterium]|nr:PAS domain S-box protein [Bacteroidota bacterium]